MGESCNINGECTCKLGYAGNKCDNCTSGFNKDTSGICQGKIYIPIYKTPKYIRQG